MIPKLMPCSESAFWYYISERYRIFLNRKAGMPKPWTNDPILQKYKFCNVFRKDDRTTAWLIDNFLEPHKNDDPSVLAFNICWFRMFNRIETGEALGWQTEWDKETILDKLCHVKTPFTGAYIIHSEPGMSKVDSITEVCGDLEHMCFTAGALVTCIQEENSLEVVWRNLQQVRHVGQFMAYQMVLDMMYCPSLLFSASDAATWTCTGPGALRGLRRLNPSLQPRDSLTAMQDLQQRSAVELAERGFFHVPTLDIHDIEFSLCELDKYCRVENGEGKPRSSYPGVK